MDIFDIFTDSDSDPDLDSIPLDGSRIGIWIWLHELWKLLHSAM